MNRVLKVNTISVQPSVNFEPVTEKNRVQQVTTNPETNDDDIPVLQDVISRGPEVVDVVPNVAVWDELEHQLTDRILQRIGERIEYIFGDVVNKNISTSIQKMTDTFVSEMKNDLQNTLEVLVTHAVMDELNRLRRKEFFLGDKQTKITEK